MGKLPIFVIIRNFLFNSDEWPEYDNFLVEVVVRSYHCHRELLLLYRAITLQFPSDKLKKAYR